MLLECFCLEEIEECTCSPNFAKLAERIDGETMMSDLENLSTRDVAFTKV